jgi:hypothetical protein
MATQQSQQAAGPSPHFDSRTSVRRAAAASDAPGAPFATFR